MTVVVYRFPIQVFYQDQVLKDTSEFMSKIVGREFNVGLGGKIGSVDLTLEGESDVGLSAERLEEVRALLQENAANKISTPDVRVTVGRPHRLRGRTNPSAKEDTIGEAELSRPE